MEPTAVSSSYKFSCLCNMEENGEILPTTQFPEILTRIFIFILVAKYCLYERKQS